MQPTQKLTLNIGGAKLEGDFPTVSDDDLKLAGVDTALDGRLMTYAYLRFLLMKKPLQESHCLPLVPDLALAAQTEKRCRALIHAMARGEKGVGANLRGLLNREEDGLKARLNGRVLRTASAAMPTWLRGHMPNADAKTFQSNASRKPGGHRS